MMRVLLTTYGSRGDVEPMVALGIALQELGADVRMCAPSDDEFTELLAHHGVPMVPFERPWRSWKKPPTPQERHQRVSDFIDAQYATVLAAAEGCDVVVAAAMSQFVARSVAEKRGIDNRFVVFCPDVINGLEGQDFSPLFGAPINTHRASIGLPPVDDVTEFMFTDELLLAADPTLGPAGAGPTVIQTGAWIRLDARPLADDLASFLVAGEAPVYVGFGSMRTVDDDSATVAVEAIREQGRRVVIGRGWAGLGWAGPGAADDSPEDSQDVFVTGEVNQQALFGKVAAVVHHGGAGTTTTAAAAGAPQVVIPQAGDQLYWARRVAELGIGAAHDGPRPTTESLSAALRTALAGEVQSRANDLAGTIRTDGATVAARLLLNR